MSRIKHKLNTSYNMFIFQILMYRSIKNRLKDEEQLGFKLVKNRDKMNDCYDKAIAIVPLLDLTDLSVYKSWYPTIDDKALVSEFLDTLNDFNLSN